MIKIKEINNTIYNLYSVFSHLILFSKATIGIQLLLFEICLKFLHPHGNATAERENKTNDTSGTAKCVGI